MLQTETFVDDEERARAKHEEFCEDIARQEDDALRHHKQMLQHEDAIDQSLENVAQTKHELQQLEMFQSVTDELAEAEEQIQKDIEDNAIFLEKKDGEEWDSIAELDSKAAQAVPVESSAHTLCMGDAVPLDDAEMQKEQEFENLISANRGKHATKMKALEANNRKFDRMASENRQAERRYQESMLRS